MEPERETMLDALCEAVRKVKMYPEEQIQRLRAHYKKKPIEELRESLELWQKKTK